jgi:HPt (histidine-containing phosphotransfer) domain-containing protein
MIESALAQGDWAAAIERLRRLREGCTMLGLHSAATALARVEAAPQAATSAQALAAASGAVARQAALLQAGGSAG